MHWGGRQREEGEGRPHLGLAPRALERREETEAPTAHRPIVPQPVLPRRVLARLSTEPFTLPIRRLALRSTSVPGRSAPVRLPDSQPSVRAKSDQSRQSSSPTTPTRDRGPGDRAANPVQNGLPAPGHLERLADGSKHRTRSPGTEGEQRSIDGRD